jgi:hypothetical protein
MQDAVFFQDTLTYNFTNHACSRMYNRIVNRNDILLCLKFGEVFYKTGIKFHVITKKIINKYHLSYELDGLCVLVSHNNRVITTYKNKEAISQIKRLSKNNKKKVIKFDA